MAGSMDLSNALKGPTPEGYLPSGGVPLNLGFVGSNALDLLTIFLSRKTGTPVFSVMGSMLKNPMGSLFGYGIGSSMETGKQVTGVPKIVQTVLSSLLGSLPLIGSVLSGMIGGIFGKTPESPMLYYDPKTRGYGRGTVLGEPFNQFDNASRMWSDVYSNLVTRVGNIPGLPDMWGFKTSAEEEILKSFLNPAEQKIYENYNYLFNKEADPIRGGPSPHQVYLASTGQ